MKVELTFSDSHARVILMYLRNRYKSKAELGTLIKKVIAEIVKDEASKDLKEMGIELKQLKTWRMNRAD